MEKEGSAVFGQGEERQEDKRELSRRDMPERKEAYVDDPEFGLPTNMNMRPEL